MERVPVKINYDEGIVQTTNNMLMGRPNILVTKVIVVRKSLDPKGRPGSSPGGGTMKKLLFAVICLCSCSQEYEVYNRDKKQTTTWSSDYNYEVGDTITIVEGTSLPITNSFIILKKKQ